MKKFLLSVLFFFSLLFYPLFCSDNNVEFKKLIVYSWLYDYSGQSEYPDVQKICGITKLHVNLFASTAWSIKYAPVRIIDVLLPEYAGIFDIFSGYSSVNDNGDWLSSLDFSSDKESTMDFLASDMKEENEKSTIILDEKKKLAVYTFGEESFSLQEKTSVVSVNADTKKISRKYYDSDMRIIKREFWDISSGFETKSPFRIEEYKYDGNILPILSVIDEDKLKTSITFSLDGKKETMEEFVKVDKELFPKSFTKWIYTKDGKLAEKYYERYDCTNSSKIIKFTQKEEYHYKVSDTAPDYFFYENGILRISSIHQSEDDFITITFFEGGFSIESYYLKGSLVKDYYYLNGNLLRRQLYGK